VEQIREGVNGFERLFHDIDVAYPDAPEKLKFNEALKGMFDNFVTDLIAHTAGQVRAAGIKSLDDVRQHNKRLAAFSPSVEAERAQCKAFLYDNLYNSAALLPEKQAAERIVTELFEYWLKNPQALPASHYEKLGQAQPERVICDYIAGMTDNFISNQHSVITNP
jgi:dGTPase